MVTYIFWQTRYKSEVPTTLFLDNNLLEQVTELSLLTKLSVLIKRNKSGTAKRKMFIGQGIEDGAGASMLLWVLYIGVELSELCTLGILMEVSSCRQYQLLTQSLSPLSSLENGS